MILDNPDDVGWSQRLPTKIFQDAMEEQKRDSCLSIESIGC